MNTKNSNSTSLKKKMLVFCAHNTPFWKSFALYTYLIIFRQLCIWSCRCLAWCWPLWFDVRCLQFPAADLRRIWPDLGQLRCVPRTFGMAQFCGVWFQFFFGIELYWIGLVALDFGSFGLSWPHFVCFRLGLGICSTFKFWILTFLMEGCRVGN